MKDDITFHLQTFDGPLDLLLHLLSKNKIEIKDIPIAEILEQYLEYLEMMSQMDIEITGDFIAMASHLVYIKTKMLLPVYKDEEEDNPRVELIESLLDYQRVKQVGGMLLERFELGKNIFEREREFLAPPEDLVYGNTTQQLIRAMTNIIERSNRKAPPPIGSFTGIIGTKRVSVNDKVISLLNMFKRSREIDFASIVLEAESRSELVAIFLAVLELSKTNRLIINESDDEYILTLSEEEQNG